MKDLPRSEVDFLLQLCSETGQQIGGHAKTQHPNRSMLAAPPIHPGSNWEQDQQHIRKADLTGQMETKEEVFANTIGLRSVGERANTRKARWQRTV